MQLFLIFLFVIECVGFVFLFTKVLDIEKELDSFSEDFGKMYAEFILLNSKRSVDR